MALALLLATANAAKAERLRALCTGVDVTFRDAPSQKSVPAVDESAATHLGNAIAKALAYSRAFGGTALASDGGLVIPALGAAWESTLTKRATGDDVPDAERARRLLGRMREFEGSRREAYWAEAMAVARDGRLECAWESDGLAGVIGTAYRPDESGVPGFWADALWETTEGRKRWELTDDERRAGDDPWTALAPEVRNLLARLD